LKNKTSFSRSLVWWIKQPLRRMYGLKSGKGETRKKICVNCWRIAYSLFSQPPHLSIEFAVEIERMK
jgi:hypothetical protein